MKVIDKTIYMLLIAFIALAMAGCSEYNPVLQVEGGLVKGFVTASATLVSRLSTIPGYTLRNGVMAAKLHTARTVFT